MKTKGILKVFIVMLALVFLMLPIVSAASLVEKRQHIREISETTLLKLYSLQPNARGYVENAAGYGVFGNWGVKLLFIGVPKRRFTQLAGLPYNGLPRHAMLLIKRPLCRARRRR